MLTTIPIDDVFDLPASLGGKIDLLFELREEKQKIAKEMAMLENKIYLIEKSILSDMEANGLEKASGCYGTVIPKTEVYPSVRDKEAFYRWVIETGSFELVQARINSAPYRERLKNGDLLPPGVETYEKTILLHRKN